MFKPRLMYQTVLEVFYCELNRTKNPNRAFNNLSKEGKEILNNNGFTIPEDWAKYVVSKPIDESKKSYYKQVWEITEKNAPNVPRIELRGKDYHLDHIVPISYGYKHNIDPSVIGSLDNLQILTREENFAKNSLYDPNKENRS